MDSTEALFGSPMALGRTRKSMKRGSLEVVARDGIEPPTPAFSGLRSAAVGHLGRLFQPPEQYTVMVLGPLAYPDTPHEVTLMKAFDSLFRTVLN